MAARATPARSLRRSAREGARHHPSEYIPGAVMKVKLHNFMTYSDVEMEPGPRLNVILGPNGTGKSSFVCALAIGLAGSTKLLGRADKISEFVKRGEQSGYSEITLATKNPNRPLVVRRDIKRKDSTSTWKVSGVTVPLERVKTEMRQLGVQLDNLCQFLPQDRVVEFARLTPRSCCRRRRRPSATPNYTTCTQNSSRRNLNRRSRPSGAWRGPTTNTRSWHPPADGAIF